MARRRLRVSRPHRSGVAALREALAELGLPALPVSTVRTPLYIPDLVTRLRPGEGFAVVEFINTRSRLLADLGGLATLHGRDIVSRLVAVVSDPLWRSMREDLRRARRNLPPKFLLLPASGFREAVRPFRTVAVRPAPARSVPDRSDPDREAGRPRGGAPAHARRRRRSR